MLVVLAIVAVLVFVLTRAASGDPVAVLLGDQATAADIASVAERLRPGQAAARAVRLLAARSAAGQPGHSRSSCSAR
jgi:ABC-type dipeptide/oligopeptide/nickel transport system permease component